MSRRADRLIQAGVYRQLQNTNKLLNHQDRMPVFHQQYHSHQTGMRSTSGVLVKIIMPCGNRIEPGPVAREASMPTTSPPMPLEQHKILRLKCFFLDPLIAEEFRSVSASAKKKIKKRLRSKHIKHQWDYIFLV